MIEERFYVTLKGKRFPLYAGVLLAAQAAGLRNLEVKPLQIPSAENGWMAVCEAIAVFEDGRTFSDIGDASPANCSPQIATAALRMASTRAKGRCLRDAIGLGETLREELPDLAQLEDEAPTAVPVQPATNGNGKAAVGCGECGLVLTAGQATLSQKTYGKNLCPACQRKVFA